MYEPTTLPAALMKEFKRPTENAAQFLGQVKSLTSEDKAWYKKHLESEKGYKFK